MRIEDKYRILSIYNRLYKYFGPQNWWPSDTDFEMICGAILTQNTSWRNVEKAIENLKRAGLLSPQKVHSLDIDKLSGVIRPAGFYRVKAKRLKNFTSFLFAKYTGRISRLRSIETSKLRDQLLSINGIGPETCDSILLYAFNRPVFVVDAYTKRIFSRHHFIKHDMDYRSTQEYLMKRLPASTKIYNEFHALIVQTAKTFCKRKNKKCLECPLYAM